ncbi:MAG: helix-turn-helix transcriptional regulator [Nitrospinae bacterium]|nr:helix-turn-helix transcriptional regulator [Nitrospinota bacterium]
MDEKIITEGVLNVFEDLGLPDADELILKAELLREITDTIESRGLKQKDLMKLLDIKQPEASYLMNEKLSRFSRERLIDYMVKLGMTVELRVKKPKKNAPLKPGALVYVGAS